ncbi:MAG: hypothetical protein JW832_15340, partial [Deltaproteobacteria bacterium]|nr:hypothetical protein [Deltaproteobacteria bacterium]
MDRNYLLNSVDDVCALLHQLSVESDSASLRRGLVRIVMYTRSRSFFSGRSTESIGDIETALIAFLDAYTGSGIEDLYGMLREIITQVPKFQIFGIDITELREITHDFDAAWRDHDAFASIAADIRKLVHQHLSEKVIAKIENFRLFLLSPLESGLIDDSVITGATSADKQAMLSSGLFQQLLQLKDKLATAWAGKEARSQQGDFAELLQRIMADADSETLRREEGYAESLAVLPAMIERLKAFDIGAMAIGKIRHGLKHLIFSVLAGQLPRKGETALRLIT